MSARSDIAAARHDVQHARDQLTDTIVELESRLTAPGRAVRRGLDVGRLVQEHPWTALAVAVGAGAAVASSGADERAASLAIDSAKQGGAAGIRLARDAPSKSRVALGSVLDVLAVKLATSVIDALREQRAATPASP